MSTIVIHNTKQVIDAVGKFHIDSQKASKNAVKVEAFRLKGVLQKELRNGTVGGFSPLREISKQYSRKPSQRSKPPLAPLAKVVRYFVADNGMPYHMEIGFVGASISNKWKEIAMRQQSGNTYKVHPAVREGLRQIGIRLQSKKRKDWRAKLFFIKTDSFVLPARDIIDTFRAKHQGEMFGNIKRNFETIMSGKRA